jgi:hypothetical protein
VQANAIRRLHAPLTLVLLFASLSPFRAQEPLDLDVLLDRLATYLERYELALSTLVADEHYVQEERRRQRMESRVTDGEVLFLRLPGGAQWYGVRDVKRVDGKPVPGASISLLELLKNPGADALQKAAAIAEASSKYNLGSRRTVNMPTVPLEALSASNHPRYIFKLRGAARVNGVHTERLEFSEFDEPTLVQSTDGANVWTRGMAWIDPATGALWRAEITIGPSKPGTLRRPEFEARIRVEFVNEPTLAMLVPKELVENFWIRGGTGHGRGRYSNYRRFSTAARLIQ